MLEVLNLINQVKEIGKDLEEGDFNHLLTLRSLMHDLDLSRVAAINDSKKYLFQLYILKKLVNDVSSNFGTDAYFSFPAREDNWANDHFNSMAKHLGEYIRLTITDSTEVAKTTQVSSCVHLMKFVEEYYTIISEVNSQLYEVSSVDTIFSRGKTANDN